MILVQMYRYLRNYVTISITGGFGERFLNLCNKEKIYLWNTAYINGGIITNVFCNDFKRLKAIRKKSGVNIKIIKKTGLSFIIKKYSERRILVSGLVLAVVMCIVMNQFVWSIEVTGSEKISNYEVIETMNKLGLRYGTYAGSFDEKNAGRQAVNLFNGKILWMAINIKGSKATIEVRDYEKEDREETNKEPCNIIADFDGQIVSSEIYAGTEVTGRGSAVKKGELIISGITENTDGSINYNSADGKISAIHSVTVKERYKKDYTFSKIENVNSFTCFNFTGISVPFYYKTADKTDNTLTYSKRYLFNGKPLPLSMKKNAVIKTQDNIKVQNDIIYCIDDFSCREYDNQKNSLVISSEYEITADKKGYNIHASYNCLDFIGEKSYIFKEN